MHAASTARLMLTRNMAYLSVFIAFSGSKQAIIARFQHPFTGLEQAFWSTKYSTVLGGTLSPGPQWPLPSVFKPRVRVHACSGCCLSGAAGGRAERHCSGGGGDHGRCAGGSAVRPHRPLVVCACHAWWWLLSGRQGCGDLDDGVWAGVPADQRELSGRIL